MNEKTGKEGKRVFSIVGGPWVASSELAAERRRVGRRKWRGRGFGQWLRTA